MLWDETDEIGSTAELRDSNAAFKSKFVWKYYLVFPVCIGKQCVAKPTGTLLRILKIPNTAHSVLTPSIMTEFYAAVKIMMQLELA